MATQAALDKLVQDGVVTVAADGKVRLTQAAWTTMVTPTGPQKKV